MKTKDDREYIRLEMSWYTKEFDNLLEQFNRADTFEAQNHLFKKLNDHRFLFETRQNFVRLMHLQDLNDVFYREEHALYSQNEPIYQSLVNKYYQSILQSLYKGQLEQNWGKQLFRLAESKVKSYSDDVLKELQEENQLISEYQQLLGKAEVTFQDEKLSLTAITPYMLSPDRGIRKRAYEARTRYFEENEQIFDELLERLVEIRTMIAEKLGYQSFIKLGYDRMNRTSVTPKEMANYRNQIKQYGVPFVSSLRKMQQKRIGVDRLKYYDERFIFPDGSPAPGNEILQNSKILFSELSQETKEFFEELMSQKNLDLQTREGKMGGAFATYIGVDKAPFVFANFTGTANDIRVLTHEAGHAFQFYMSRHMNIPEYIVPVDSAELFSFTMERFAWPWMSLFFGEDTTKYKFGHLTEAFFYMPLASAVDDFEHFLYEFPEASIEQRKQKWRELETIYLPDLNYDGDEFMEQGGSFYAIAHLFMSPFYFMDYELAHFCAVQLWDRYNRDPDSAWKSYLMMCQTGGSKSFKELLQAANLNSPFEENSLQPLLQTVQDWIEGIDDQRL
jgi:M3 family oligoendopeptidase